MRRWRYQARLRDGRKTSGRIEAAGREEAMAALLADGLTPIGLSPLSERQSGRLGYERAARLSGELARLSASGLPLETAITLAADAETHEATRAALQASARALSDGAGPAAAFAQLSGPAGRILAAAIRAGERSGDLSGALSSIAPLLAATAKFRSKLLSLMLYPAAVAMTSLGVVLVFFFFVVPTLRPVLERAGEAGSGAAWLIAAADIAPAVLIGLLLAVLAGVVLSGFREVRAALGRMRDRLLLGPLGFGLALDIEAALFARLYGALLSSGVPAAEAIAEAAGALGNSVLRARLASAASEVREGEVADRALGEVFGGQSLVVRASRIGERSGTGASLITEAGAVLAERAESRLERVSALAAPVIIVLLGLVVGALVIGLFSSLSSLPGSIGS